MKILVLGGSGVLGSFIVEHYSSKKDIVFYTFFKNDLKSDNGKFLDITQKHQVMEIIDEIKPDIVFHTVAMTNVDLCEKDKKLATKINVIGTDNIVKACKKIQCKIIYFSTAAVFDGLQKEYFENDKPSPTSVYGQTKLEGEKIVIDSDLEYLILRTDQPYGWSKNWQHSNSVLRVVDFLTENKQFHEIIDWYNTPTYIPDLIKVLDNLITFEKTGIYHVVGNDFVNRFEWSIKVAKEFNLNEKLLAPIKSSELNLSVKRNNIKLNNDKSYNDTKIKMNGIETGLKKMLSDKNNI